MGYHPKSHVNLRSRSLIRSCEKWEMYISIFTRPPAMSRDLFYDNFRVALK